MTNRNKLTVVNELVAGLFAKFAQCDLLNCFRWAARVSASGYSVDLTGGHFPDRLTDGDAFLANENNLTLRCHRRDNDGCFPVDDCPHPWLVSRWRSDVIGHDIEMRVSKVPLARDGFPRAFLHAESL